MARLVAVAFGQTSMPLHQIRALRVCMHTLAVARKLDYFVWDLVHVKGVTAIAELIAAKEQFHDGGASAARICDMRFAGSTSKARSSRGLRAGIPR